VQRASHALAANTLNTIFAATSPPLRPKSDSDFISEDGQRLEKQLIEAFSGPEGDGNPMRSQEDRVSAWRRWQTATRFI
jgi:hypothetical protein